MALLDLARVLMFWDPDRNYACFWSGPKKQNPIGNGNSRFRFRFFPKFRNFKREACF